MVIGFALIIHLFHDQWSTVTYSCVQERIIKNFATYHFCTIKDRARNSQSFIEWKNRHNLIWVISYELSHVINSEFQLTKTCWAVQTLLWCLSNHRTHARLQPGTSCSEWIHVWDLLTQTNKTTIEIFFPRLDIRFFR